MILFLCLFKVFIYYILYYKPSKLQGKICEKCLIRVTRVGVAKSAYGPDVFIEFVRSILLDSY